MRHGRLISFIILIGIFTNLACSKLETVSDKVADDTAKFGACDNYNDKILGTLVDAIQAGQDLPSSEELRKSLGQKLNLSEDSSLIKNVMRTYELMTVDTQNRFAVKSSKDLIETMTALSIGDSTTKEREEMVLNLKTQFAKVQNSASSNGLSCDTGLNTPNQPVQTPPTSSKLHPVHSGALKVLATAYQNCQTLRLPAMDLNTPDTQGISIIGNHPDGGLKRKVSSLSALQKTHYYIRQGIGVSPACIQVPKNPLIYDFGGKPYTTSSDSAELNMFKDAGTGTSVLGIDCSAYVFSAMAASGLRLSPTRKMRAGLVHGVYSTMFMNPEKNGLSCLGPVDYSTQGKTLSGDMQSGDIMAVSGHIVIVENTGSDPFGLARAKGAADCTKEKLKVSGYQFNILQSSPVKSGIGLDRMTAASYLASSGKMQTAFQDYAVTACKAKFGIKSSLSSTGRLIRHKRTPECLDQNVRLTGESCVQTCAK